MLPQTTQATHTEVEGDTTVEFTGTMGDGTLLDEAASTELENQTADQGAEEAPSTKVDESDTNLSEKPPRFERRAEKLIDALKSKTDEASELRKQLESFKGTPAQTEQTNLPPWLQSQDSTPIGDEVTPEQYRGHVLETARTLVKSELTAYQTEVDKLNNFKDDLSYVENTYDAFRKGSEGYDPVKDKKLTELYQKLSKADPTTRLKDIADDLMGFLQAGQEIGKQELKTSVIKREAEAAVTPGPNGSLPDKNQDWDSMSLKQKEAWMKENGIWDK